MSANLRGGKMVQLDRRPEPEEQITEDDAKEPNKVAWLFMRILRAIARVTRRWSPRRLDVEDIALDATGTKKFSLPHKFGGGVRYWVVEWDGAASPNIRAHADTTGDVLVITSTSAGNAVVRVEESG